MRSRRRAGGALAQQRPAQLDGHARELAVEVALVDRFDAVPFQFDEQAVGAAAVADQGVARQAQEVVEPQRVLVTAAAVRVPDGVEERRVEDEVADLQHAGGQGAPPHQFPIEPGHR
jgi:hypothetical protein